ncbi:hypothetical protein [Plantactinospora sp. GCM10030261]|uniref:hypothetical protein n=1 Tax=Plantactinospora sp. GCM10030261 TaxID=3273420 RepID=UPI00360BDC2D
MAGLSRSVARAAALVLSTAVLSGCGVGGDGGGAGGGAPGGAEPAEDGAAEARTTVQAYLDAMLTKDRAAGRAQLCAPLHESFDQSAQGPNGDFAGHFKVASAQITEVVADGGRQRVSTVIRADVGRQQFTRGIAFVVTPVDGAWCIAEETASDATAPPDAEASSPGPAEPGGAANPTGAPSPSS